MTKVKIEIKNRWTGKILFEYENDNATIRQAVLKAIESGANLRDADLSDADLSDADLSDADLSGADLSDADLSDADLRGANLSDADLSGADLSGANLSDANLRGANLRGADLRDADLRGANLSGANLSDANLRGANLRGANLRGADLRDADLRGANLSVYKTDMFMVLLHAIPEIKFLKQNIIDGKIDGSTYEGECACLSGTLFNGATKNNGVNEKPIKDLILSCRDAYRPIEQFFANIRKGDTPATNPFSKLALEWVEEFESLIKYAI